MKPTRTGEARAADGTSLFWRGWEAEPEVARLAILHGVGEHGGRYGGLAGALCAGGVSCYALDQRGHGRSGGPRTHVDRWHRYEDDARAFVDDVLSPAADRTTFLYGHSMGSLICLTLALEGESARIPGFGGWIVSAAGIRPTGIAKPHLVLVARLLSRVLPRVRLDLGIAPEALSHDPDVVRRYREDPLVEGRATVRWGTEALGAVGAIVDGAHRIADALLILHGGEDPLAEAEGSRWLAGAVAGETTLVVYPDSLHEPHHEPGRAAAAEDVLRWIRSRLP